MRSPITGLNTGTIINADTVNHSPVTQTSLEPLRPIEQVPAAAGPVGVPGVGVFVGRGDELAQLHAALSGEGAVVVWAVAGLGGIGKSTLVARYALEHVTDYKQVVWIAADSAANLQAGLAAFALALEQQLSRVLPGEALAERALGWLAAHSDWLLVLDNVADPHLVRDLLPRVGAGRVVVTSRRSTGWAGIAEPLTLGVLEPEAAHKLVALTVGSANAGLLAGVERLCDRLGFLPLAVEQAAAYMAQNSVSALKYLELLDSAPGDLFGDGAQDTPQERTLAQVWAVSLDALADEPLAGPVLRVLAWLSPDGIPRDLLAGLGTETQVVRALGRLAAYSMITLDQHGTITVHRLLQEVARTSQQGDPHRAPALIDAARAAAVDLLYAAIPGKPLEPASWPGWRQLTVQLAAYAERAPAQADTGKVSLLLERTGTFLREHGSFAQAIDFLKRAVVSYERLRAPEGALSSRNSLAGAYWAAGKYQLAIDLQERTLADCERTLGPDHPQTSTTRNNLALAYQDAGQLERAIELHESALADRERVLGSDHPDTLASRNNLATAYQQTGQLERAIDLHERTLADRERVLGSDHPDTLGSRGNLAVAYQDTGQLERAVDLFERALADCERVLGSDHPDTLASRNNLAVVCVRTGQFQRSIELHERALAGRKRVLGPNHPDTLRSRKNLAKARAAAERAEAHSLSLAASKGSS